MVVTQPEPDVHETVIVHDPPRWVACPCGCGKRVRVWRSTITLELARWQGETKAPTP